MSRTAESVFGHVCRHASFVYALCVLLFFLIPLPGWAAGKNVHIVVALCDNKYQGIVPVPAHLGNGQNPTGNLYWGAAYGVKTYFKKQPGWKLVQQTEPLSPHILERIVLHHPALHVTLVADAYDGYYMEEAITTFLGYVAGKNGSVVTAKNVQANAGGNADMLVFIGHNGLMDFSLGAVPQGEARGKRDAAVFACMSKPYFLDALHQAGAGKVVLTTNLMSPEAYTSAALIEAWAAGGSVEMLREAVATAYAKYQKCSMKAARGLFRAEVVH